MKNIEIIIVLLILSACNPEKQRTDTSPEINNAARTTVIDNIENTNSILLNESVVIFLVLDTTEINEMQSKYSEEDYAEIVADMTWYPSMAGEQLDSLSIKHRQFDKDSIIIKHTDKSETILLRKDLDGDMLLIHPNKKPIITHSIDFDKAQILNYFDRIN